MPIPPPQPEASSSLNLSAQRHHICYMLEVTQKSLEVLDCQSVLSGDCVKLSVKTLSRYFFIFTCFAYNSA